MAFVSAAVLSTALSGSAQARPDNEPTKAAVEVPKAPGCAVPKSIIKKGQRNLKSGPLEDNRIGGDLGRRNNARPLAGVSFVKDKPSSAALTAIAVTSWFDSAGKFQVRAVVLKNRANTDSLNVAFVDGKRPGAGSLPAADDQHRLGNAVTVAPDATSACVTATADNVTNDLMVYVSWNGEFKQEQIFNVPLPTTTIRSQGRDVRWESDDFTVRKTNELARLAADALNGKIRRGSPEW